MRLTPTKGGGGYAATECPACDALISLVLQGGSSGIGTIVGYLTVTHPHKIVVLTTPSGKTDLVGERTTHHVNDCPVWSRLVEVGDQVVVTLFSQGDDGVIMHFYTTVREVLLRTVTE
jgi:hypothetical protein